MYSSYGSWSKRLINTTSTHRLMSTHLIVPGRNNEFFFIITEFCYFTFTLEKETRTIKIPEIN